MSPVRFLAVAACLAASLAAAQTAPTKPVKLVLAAPTATAEQVARTIVPRLGEAIGQPVAIDTAGGAQAVAKAAPDGTTLLLATPSLAAVSALQPNLPYGGLKAFAPVGRVAMEPLVVVATATLSMSSLPEFIALAKANPGLINYASPGVGSPSYLAAEHFKSVATVQLAHLPAKSTDAAIADVVAGRAKIAFAGFGAVDAALRAGKLRALAVTGPSRLALLPDVPTMRESGMVDYDLTGWYGVLVPAATPKATIDRLNADLRKAVQAPDVRDKLTALLGAEPRVSTPEELGAELRREVALFERLARELNLKVE